MYRGRSNLTLSLILFQGKSSNKKGQECLYDCTFDQIERRIAEIEEYERSGRPQREDTALYKMKVKMCTKKIAKGYGGALEDCVEDLIKLELESTEETTGWGRKQWLKWAFDRKNDRLKDHDFAPFHK